VGVSGGSAWTIRRDSLELWQDLVLQDRGEVDFHAFWKYWKLTSSPNTSKLVLGPPDWSSDLFVSQGTISGAIKKINCRTFEPKKQNMFRETRQPLKIVIVFYKMAFFIMPFFACLPRQLSPKKENDLFKPRTKS
jgi:hypothetical protein